MSDLGNKKVFANNLNHYMIINNVDRNKLCRDLNFNYTTVREWTNGTAYPRIDKIEMMANYFDIQKSNLIEERNEHERGLQNFATKNGVKISVDTDVPLTSEDVLEAQEFLRKIQTGEIEKFKK